MRTLAAVTANAECAHRSADGKIHGHSYQIEVWFMAGPDLVKTRAAILAIVAKVDHSMLEESVGAPSQEAMAEWLFLQCESIKPWPAPIIRRVVVRRDTLGFIVEVTP